MTTDVNKIRESLKSENYLIKEGEVVEGETYPLYGMITKFIDETPNNVVVEINHYIKAVMQIPEIKNINLLKERSFDPGIFVAKIISKYPVMVVEVSTVVFGKRSDLAHN